jgi:Na+/phosphate symporter
MGTSLADGAWGRESAVYRISGVLTVIGGWFFTALIAFIVSFLIATLIFFGKLPVILVLIGTSIFILLRTHAFHKRKLKKEENLEHTKLTESIEILNNCESEIKSSILQVSKLLFLTYDSFAKENHKELKTIKKQAKKLNQDVKNMKESIPTTLKIFQESEIESGHYYVQIIDHLKETTNALNHIISPAYKHLDNNHSLDSEQNKELKEFNEMINEFFNFSISMLQNRNSDNMDEYLEKREILTDSINSIIKNRIKILKKTQKGSKVSMTYIEMLTESKNLVLHLVQLVKADAGMVESIKFKE